MRKGLVRGSCVDTRRYLFIKGNEQAFGRLGESHFPVQAGEAAEVTTAAGVPATVRAPGPGGMCSLVPHCPAQEKGGAAEGSLLQASGQAFPEKAGSVSQD